MFDWKSELTLVRDRFFVDASKTASRFLEEVIVPICEKHNLDFIGCDELSHGTFRTIDHIYVHPYASGLGCKIYQDCDLEHVFISLSLPLIHEYHLYDFVKSYKR